MRTVVIGLLCCTVVVVAGGFMWKGCHGVFAHSIANTRKGAMTQRMPGALIQAGIYFQSPKELRLAEAILHDDPKTVKAALLSGVSVNALGKRGMTPLLFAIMKQKRVSFLALLEAGANPNLSTSEGESVTSVSARMPDPRYLEAVLKKGGSVEFRDGTRKTPLILAAWYQRSENVRILLRHGAQVNAQDAQGDDALIASLLGAVPNLETTRTLIEAGASMDRPNLAGLTARDYVANFSDPALSGLFAKGGVR